jgi:hypothetical protein
MSFLQSFKHPLSVRTFYRTNTPPLPRHRITVHTTRQTPPSFNALPLFELSESPGFVEFGPQVTEKVSLPRLAQTRQAEFWNLQIS